MELLLKEYQESLRLTEKMRESASEEDQKIYAGMVGDIEYAINWLKTGQRPVPKKSRFVGFRDGSTIERIKGVNLFNPFGPDPYGEVEKMIDAERKLLQ